MIRIRVERVYSENRMKKNMEVAWITRDEDDLETVCQRVDTVFSCRLCGVTVRDFQLPEPFSGPASQPLIHKVTSAVPRSALRTPDASPQPPTF